MRTRPSLTQVSADIGKEDLTAVSESPRAVVFDLFGTLVTYPPGAPHVRAMAERLGIPFETLHREWRKLRAQRDAGELDACGALRICCDASAIDRTDAELEAAAVEATVFLRAVLKPRDGALDVLRALRERGQKIGLISDANIETSIVWPETTLAPFFGTAVFSSVEHRRKPDPALYRVVCDRLGVAASDCVYIGNGDGDELAGATSAGMRAVLFTAPGESPGRGAASWTGARISDLRAAVEIAGSAKAPTV